MINVYPLINAVVCLCFRKMFQLPEVLLADFPKERLLLNRPVMKIIWDSSFTGDDGRVYPVSVECENGERFLCDHVVVTISLGNFY